MGELWQAIIGIPNPWDSAIILMSSGLQFFAISPWETIPPHILLYANRLPLNIVGYTDVTSNAQCVDSTRPLLVTSKKDPSSSWNLRVSAVDRRPTLVEHLISQSPP